RRPWLLRDSAGQRRNEDAAGFGLPPRVDDRATAFTNDAMIPFPSLGVDWLTHRPQQPQGRATGALYEIIAGAHQSPDGRRRCVENVDLPLVDDMPEPGRGRVGRYA